ncbi:galactosamine-6-phosphate isomerase [Flavobacteriaceae bacterium F89]|uniref:Galactosamine-6-phosphate isomerase n=1 Tax=Cerina litoralis TaxID=2874477 RepID=A0AAE3EVR3_9FLAO|nr:galactosamine-6-phosphate isomerase [Cerina litoralis]MCG2461223.1 galactosamine-6-phosphate isomerase [Cerina litoralis]
MNIHNCTGYEEMSQKAGNSLLYDLARKPNLLLCTATGNSPIGLYNNLVKSYAESPHLFGGLRIIKLDEWGGIPLNEPNSCETFIQQKILEPLNVPNDRYISFDSNPSNPEGECIRIQSEILDKGPMDTCILGLGKNGHLGFNEPASMLEPYPHIAKLSPESLQHNMTRSMDHRPTYGLTLGMANILQSKKIILLLTGSGKKEVIGELMKKKVTPQLPASFLWLHPQVECYVDAGCMGKSL